MNGINRVLATVFALCATLATGAPIEERAIVEKVSVKAGVGDVWKAWTTTEGVKTFFAPDAKIELRVDGPFQVYMDPTAMPGLKGADDMRIIGFQENRMLSFNWNAPPSLPEARKQRSIVIVRFESRGDSLTDVTLTHIGFGDGGEWDKNFAYFTNSWPRVLKNLKDRFEIGPVDWKPWLDQLAKIRAAKDARK